MRAVDDELIRLRVQLGRRVKELRGEQTQELLAETADVSWRQLQRLEAGTPNTPVDTILKVAIALGVHPGSLFEKPSPTVQRRRGRPKKTPG